MHRSLRRTRHSLFGMSLVAGLAIAGLPTLSQANNCMMNKPYGMMNKPYGMMNKPYGHMGSMRSYGPRYYSPMKSNGHGHKESATQQRSYDKPEQPAPSAEAHGSKAAAQPAVETGPDIIETAAAAQNFKTLIRAAEAAGLYDTLRGDGPFTVFAPSDAAFAGLPEGTLEALLADRDRLVAVLSYHVVPERLTAADLLQRREFTTVQGQTLSIANVSVASADIEASNGIIHVIDTVLMPSL